MHEVGSRVHGANFTGTPYIPVYAMLAVSGCFSCFGCLFEFKLLDCQSYQVLTPSFLCFYFISFFYCK